MPKNGEYYYDFDEAKWASYTLFEQLGNIAAEVGRTFSAQRRGNAAAAEGAFFRGIDLINASAKILARERSPKLRELLRAREVFATNYYAGHDDGIEQYFMQYAIAARAQR